MFPKWMQCQIEVCVSTVVAKIEAFDRCHNVIMVITRLDNSNGNSTLH